MDISPMAFVLLHPMSATGPGPLFLAGWGALVAFVILATIAVGGWIWLLRQNRGRIEAEKKSFGKGSPEGRRKRLKLR